MMRIAAVCLLLLAASPFTSPFLTFEPGAGSSTAPTFDAAKTKQAHDDVLAAPAFTAAARRAQDPGGDRAADAGPARQYRGHRAILRL